MDNQEAIIDPEATFYQQPFFYRLIGLVCPPLALRIIWRITTKTRRSKIFETVVLAVYLPFYLLLLFAGLVWLGAFNIEWKGGDGPSIVRRKTVPDYEALEVNRATNPSPARVGSPGGPFPHPYWTDFRGPGRDGHYDEQAILTDWPAEGPRLLWRQPVGGGYASFVVAKGLAYTIEQRRAEEAIVAYNLDTGREVWNHTYPASFSEWMGGDGPRATPTYHDGYLYSLGATGEFRSLNAATGLLVFQLNFLEDNGSENLRYGLAASPIVYRNQLILLGGEPVNGHSIASYDRVYFKRLWSSLDDKQAYTSPLLVDLAGKTQLVVVSASRIMGIDPMGGAVLWEYPWKVGYDNAICTPLVIPGDRLFVSAGYGVGSVMLKIAGAGGRLTATELWRNRSMKNKFNASVLYEGHIYGLDEGVLACVGAEDGERKWREGRYGYGQLLLASGHLIVLGGKGDLILVRANPTELDQRARFHALDGKTWNVPALAHGRLLVRNAFEMACYDLRVPSKSN